MTQVLSLSLVLKKSRHKEINLFKVTPLVSEHREWGCRICTFNHHIVSINISNSSFPSWITTADGPDIVTGSQRLTLEAHILMTPPPLICRPETDHSSGTLTLLVGVTLELISPCSFLCRTRLTRNWLSSSPFSSPNQKGKACLNPSGYSEGLVRSHSSVTNPIF